MKSLKNKLFQIEKLWGNQQYDQTLTQVEELQKFWPGHSKLLVLWANLVQLQENPTHTLQEAKDALQRAWELDEESPAAGIELGHFLDSVEDDPQAAMKVFSKATAQCRHLLIGGLIGQAKALLQLEKKSEALECLKEALDLANRHSQGKKRKSSEPESYLLIQKPTPNEPFAEEFENLFAEFGGMIARD